jgi:hypothetical protein
MEAAAKRAGRDPCKVRLVAVSKTVDLERIREAIEAGVDSLGENYVQEAHKKIEALEQKVSWHFIGHLQSNKVKYLPGKVSLIHSLDRLTLAEEIDRQWAMHGTPADVLIEVNLGGETSKGGVDEPAVEALLRRLAQLPHLTVRGLMAIPPYFADPEKVRPFFRRLRELAIRLDALALPGVTMTELSMGMSHDFAVAIEEGATLVRIGTAIFGERGGR